MGSYSNVIAIASVSINKHQCVQQVSVDVGDSKASEIGQVSRLNPHLTRVFTHEEARAREDFLLGRRRRVDF
jgi:hypothetical protein